MSSFNIIVPSDTNKDLYKENTSSNFKVRLNQPIELDPRGNWEAALVQLQVPANLKRLEYDIAVEIYSPVIMEDKRKFEKKTTVNEFLKDLNSLLKKLKFTMMKSGDKVFEFDVCLKTYYREFLNPPVFVFDFIGKCNHEAIKNVMFMDDSQIEAGHLGEDSLPIKLKISNDVSTLLQTGDRIISPWPALRKFNFDRSMFDPPGNETLYLPLDDHGVRMTDCYHDVNYYVYFYQHTFMSKPRAVYIPKATEQGVVGLFQESLKRVLDFSETVDITKPIHASTVNFSVSSSDPYRSRLNIALAVKKTPGHYTIFRNFNSLLQIFICKELASVLNMANSSVWIYFPQWYESTMQQRLSAEHRERLEDGDQFNGMACVPATKKDVFSTVEGKYDWNFPRVRTVEANGDYTRVHYVANFKLSGREEFRSGLGTDSSSQHNQTRRYNKLYDKDSYKIKVKIPMLKTFHEDNQVQKLDVHCNNLLYDPVLRSVTRPVGGGGVKIVDTDIRQLHYKKIVGGLQRLQEFQIQIKDERGRHVPFEDGYKSVVTMNFKPTRTRELSHFSQTVTCQEPYLLEEPIHLKTTDRWEVALMDMTLPKQWINVKENEMVFHLGDKKFYPNPAILKSVFDNERFVIPKGYYTSETLVAKMNEMASNPFTNNQFRFYIYPNSKLFKVDITKEQERENMSITITSPLCKLLGWETEKEFNTTAGWQKPDDTDSWVTDNVYSFRNKKQVKIDVNRGFNIMYVYLPGLTEPVHVGHIMTDLLNYTVPGLAEERRDSYFVQFNSLSYVKVKQQLHSLKQIQVDIRNELGELIEFMPGQIKPTASLKFVKTN